MDLFSNLLLEITLNLVNRILLPWNLPLPDKHIPTMHLNHVNVRNGIRQKFDRIIRGEEPRPRLQRIKSTFASNSEW